MKSLILLATFLMMPIVMKFQQHALENRVFPAEEIRLQALLAKEGVIEPKVQLRNFAARIGGQVADQQSATELGEMIKAQASVRVVENRLNSVQTQSNSWKH